MSTSAYPVHVDARLDSQLTRWTWLLKWLLVIPHYVVLVFLWLAFAVLSIVAMFAILFTGRYPRAIFDFNVGVLRWTWRVSYYAYGALGTDRYPPFTLSERPDYPAHLEIDYPERLSRGLALVKWWLLALPHYLVVALFLGLGFVATGDADRGLWVPGLLGLMVLIAAVALLFTGRYPQSIFDFVLGMNRWVIRVAAYAGLMTDVYPPFRLDLGGSETGSSVLTTAPEAPAVAPGAARPSSSSTVHWSAGRVLALVAGCVVLMGSLGLGVGGGALAIADRTARDDAGFLMSDQQTLTTDTFAVTSTNIEIQADLPTALLPQKLLGTVKLTAEGAGDTPLFVGIASTADVDAYFEGVRHARLVELTDEPVYDTTGSSAPASAPADQDIWVADSSGTGSQSLTWKVEEGDWTVVMMNADASAGVTGDVAAGATFPALDWLVPTLLVTAGVGLIVGMAVIALAIPRGPRRAR